MQLMTKLVSLEHVRRVRICLAGLLLWLSTTQATLAMSPYHEACIRTAAATYYQPAGPVSYAGLLDLIHALMGVEGGCGRQHINGNGSIDYGCMQINSSTLHRLARAGYRFNTATVQYNDCQNIMLGTWVLASELRAGGGLWTAIGNYNSHTPRYNLAYQGKVWRKLQSIWAERLARR